MTKYLRNGQSIRDCKVGNSYEGMISRKMQALEYHINWDLYMSKVGAESGMWYIKIMWTFGKLVISLFLQILVHWKKIDFK